MKKYVSTLGSWLLLAAVLVVVGGVIVAPILADIGKQPSLTTLFGVGDTIPPGEIDTVTFTTAPYGAIALFFQFNGDSAKINLDYGYLDTWVRFDSLVYSDTAAAVDVALYKQYSHAAIANGDTTATFDNFLFPRMRARIANLDAAKIWLDSMIVSTDSVIADTGFVGMDTTWADSFWVDPDADTLKSVKLSLIGR